MTSGIFHPELLPNQPRYIFDMKLHHMEKFWPLINKIVGAMSKNVKFEFFKFTFWDILKKTLTETVGTKCMVRKRLDFLINF